MRPLILHHYDFSNFSEKVRLIMGLKDLSWQSVQIPATAPKPDYTPLTGGYRRAPALQIGADIYCDTRLIADVLEEIEPLPSLFPGLNSARTRALTNCLTPWAEGQMFWPLALYITGLNADKFPDHFHQDRAQLHNKPPPNLDRVKASVRKNLAQFRPQYMSLDDLLSGDQPYLLGDEPGLADIIYYEAPWFLDTIGGPNAMTDAQPNTCAWVERIKSIGHGTRTEIEPAQALDGALNATPSDISPMTDYVSPEGVTIGDEVTVCPLDENSPATGALVYLDDDRIVLRCIHPRVGDVNVHFPRVGYRMRRS
jgi:glutathione S-transferase